MNDPAAPGRLSDASSLPGRVLASLGAVMLAGSIGLSAYAAHAAGVEARSLYLAAAMAFGHGLGLVSLAPAARRRLTLLALSVALLGMLLFAGSLVAAHFLATPTRLAPAGGSLMIFGWLIYAADALRR